MKKIFALTFVLLLSVAAFAQIDLYVTVGTPDGSAGDPMMVSNGKWYEVPIYLQVLPDPAGHLGNLTYPLGIQLAYVDSLTGGALNYPFTYDPLGVNGWTLSEFGNWHTDTSSTHAHPVDSGWASFTYLGNARYTNPSAPLFWDHVQMHAFSFTALISSDTLLIGDTICDAFGPGVDPATGLANAADSLGITGATIYEDFACIYFSPNQAPVIDADDLPYDCGYQDFTVLVDVTDADGDPVSLTTNYPEISVTLVGSVPDPPVTGEPVTYTYELGFDMEDFCGACWVIDDLELTANDGINDPVVFAYTQSITIIGELHLSMDPALYIWPGFEDWMPVYLDACGYCFCLGGFELTIVYDPSVLTITEVALGAMLAGGEYWNVSWNVLGPGSIKLVFINDLNNQTQVEPICDIDESLPLFELKFLLAVMPYPTNFCIPICFYEGDPNWQFNTISDEDGYHVWIKDGCDDPPDSTEYGTMLLTWDCGNVKVMDEHNLIFGDINWNGFPYEVGDVVLLANHLIDPLGYPFTLRQMFASDVNHDGFQATIADLIWMINYIIGAGGAGKVMPIDVVATISMPENASDDVSVTINSDANIGGALVQINHTGVELGVPASNGTELQYSDNGDVMTVLVTRGEGTISEVLFTVPMLTEGTISFGEVSVSDDRGALMDARAELTTPLPTEFSVAQNFPNPFNATTKINFALPIDANVNIAIYNVAGQLVEAMDQGLMPAGTHSIVWNASDVASGVYFYKVSAGDFSKTLKMTLLK